MEKEKILSFVETCRPYLRISIAITITIAVYCAFRATLIELESPGQGALSIYNDRAYVFMGGSFLLSLPLLYLRLNALNNFYKTMTSIVGSDEDAQTNYISQYISMVIKRSIPQIVIGVVFAIILYFVLTSFVVTPEVQESYIVNSRSAIGVINYSSINLSDYPNTPILP